jgi:hypothetical protein
MTEAHEIRGGNFCTSSGLLTATGAETVYDTTVAIWFCINGKSYVKATVADGATPTTDAITGAAFNAILPDKGCIFVWTLNAAGTVGLAQGPIESMDGTTDEFLISPSFPGLLDTLTPFAYTVYSTDGTSSASGLRPGTDNWNATGLTVAHQNIMTLPTRPQES